jgi:hypothetical protein
MTDGLDFVRGEAAALIPSVSAAAGPVAHRLVLALAEIR